MRVRFEPLGEEIECDATETVLDAAFRQGYNLAHGCREGQCSACKCYLLAGDLDLAPYSNFALSDAERANGYALMCRALPESDVTIELLHYDPDNYRLENPISEWPAQVVAVTELTSEIVTLTLTVPGDFTWVPGQYVDLHAAGVTRSFSIANLPGDGRVDLIIRRYPGGRLSGRLGTEIVAGSDLRLTGPYGALRLRSSSRPIAMVAGGSGIGPVLALLRQLATLDGERPARVYFAAREPFLVEEICRLGCQLTLVDGRDIAAVLDVEGDHDVYMCEPPPLLDAAEGALTAAGVDLCFEPIVGTLIRRELGTRAASANGDIVTPVLARVASQEWEWERCWTVALVQFLLSDGIHGDHNRAVVDGWGADWSAHAREAAAALTPSAERVEAYARRMMTEALSIKTAVHDPGAQSGHLPRAAPPQRAASSDGSYDYVGIVMAKSAEGDAVARFFAGRADVIEQPAFLGDPRA